VTFTLQTEHKQDARLLEAMDSEALLMLPSLKRKYGDYDDDHSSQEHDSDNNGNDDNDWNDTIYDDDTDFHASVDGSDDDGEEVDSLRCVLKKAMNMTLTTNDIDAEIEWMVENEEDAVVGAQYQRDNFDDLLREVAETEETGEYSSTGATSSSSSSSSASSSMPAAGINSQIINTFPVTPLVAHFIDVANSEFCALEYPLDYHYPLDSTICHATETDFKTKAEFCEALKAICSFYSIEKAGMDAFLQLLRVFLPKLNLPCTTVKTTGNVVWHPEKYLLIDKRRIVVDACVNQCILYVGEYETDIFCPVCYSPRFTPCNYGGCCKDKEMCNPAINLSHKRQYRTANQVAFYRPIIPKLIQMYKRDPSVFAYESRRHKKEGYLTDLMDGSIPKAEMAAMNSQFESVKVDWEAANPGKHLIQLSLVLSLTYDGDLIFKRRQGSLWPMLCSIMNCDPSYRTKLGLGLFMVLNHNMRVGSGAEMSLKDEVLTEELKQLKSGLVFEFVDDNNETISLFLQARLVFLHCDTKGHEKNICVQASGAMAGCPFCGTTFAVSRPIIGSRSVIGHTLYLAQDHVFRSMGECGHCDGYFGELGRDNNMRFGKQISTSALKIKLKRRKNRGAAANNGPAASDDDYEDERNLVEEEGILPRGVGNRDRVDVGEGVDDGGDGDDGGGVPIGDAPMEGDFEDNDFDDAASVISRASVAAAATTRNVRRRLVVNASTVNIRHSATLPENTSYVSTMFPYSEFGPYLWFARDDDRLHQPLGVMSNEQFIANSAAADGLLGEYESSVADGTQKLLKTAPTFPVNGVHPKIPKFFHMGSMRLEYLTPDLMHAAALSIGLFMAIIMGLRGVTNKSRKLSVDQGRFPFLQDCNNPVPFVASVASRKLADSVNYCLNIPQPYKTDYVYDFPFHYQGSMNSHQTLVFMMCFASYIFSFTNISRVYKVFYERYAWDLCQILNPVLSHDMLDYLCQHVIETKATQEGLFPESEQNFIFHEIIHVVHHLIKFGPARSLMCFFSERAMKSLSDGVPDGGQKYVITVTDRFVDKENTYDKNMESYRASLNDNTDNFGLYSSQVLKLVGGFKPVILNNDIKDILFNNLQEFIGSQEVRYRNVKSPFYRVYWTFESVCKAMDDDFSPSLSEWVSSLFSLALLSRDGFNGQSFLHLGLTDINFDSDISHNLTTDDDIALHNSFIETEMVLKRVLYASDLTGIIADLANFGNIKQPIAAFTRAIVKGVKFSARGEKYSETQLVAEDYSGTNLVGTVDYDLDNPLNDLSKNWYQTLQYSSWARVRDWYTLLDNSTSETVAIRDRTYFAQLNYFFRLYIPNDKLLNGLAFANSVLRNPGSSTIDKVRRHFWVDPSAKSYHPHKHFISLNYFEGTALAVSALDDDSLPIINPLRAAKVLNNLVIGYPLIISDQDSSCVDRLYFIELHNERMGIGYMKIESDDDKTKLMEPIVLKYHQDRR
jgi:hypothetical protein